MSCGATITKARSEHYRFSLPIAEATVALMKRKGDASIVKPEDIGYIWFTVTDDLDAGFPADAARVGLGWTEVPLICGREIPVPGSLGRCIRVLIAYGNKATTSYTYDPTTFRMVHLTTTRQGFSAAEQVVQDQIVSARIVSPARAGALSSSPLDSALPLTRSAGPTA